MLLFPEADQSHQKQEAFEEASLRVAGLPRELGLASTLKSDFLSPSL